MAKFLDQDGLSHLLSKLDDRYATIDHVDSSLQGINSSISTIQTNINSLQNFCDYKSQNYVSASIGAPPENNIETNKNSFSIRELKVPSNMLLTNLNYNLKIGPAIQYAPSGNGYINNTSFGPGLLIIRFYDSSITNPTWKNKTVTIICANTDSAMGGRYSECRFVADQTTLTSSGTRLNYCENIEASRITVTGINNTTSSNVSRNSMLLCHLFGYPGDPGVTYVRVIPVNCKVQYPVLLEGTT